MDRAPNDSICRWGFLGAAAIARKNWKAVRLSGNGHVAAVASRSLDRAASFIEQCSLEVPFVDTVDAVGSYQQLLERDDIDAVYIPLPTGVRKEWVIRAAEAGKHVLSEKPVAINAEDAREMIAACRQSNVQFMDGVMFDHGDRIAEVARQVRSGAAVGKLRRINSHFSFVGDEAFSTSNIRASQLLEPHGCLGDLGWYCIRFTLWMTGFELPESVSARTLTAIGNQTLGQQVPGEFSAELSFSGGVSAGFYCSFLTSNQQTALVSGERGYVSLDDFVLPFYDAQARWSIHQHDLQIDNCRWNFCRRTQSAATDEYPSGESNAPEVKMVRRLAEAALSKTVDHSISDRALKTQLIVDACRRSAIAGGQAVQVEPL